MLQLNALDIFVRGGAAFCMVLIITQLLRQYFISPTARLAAFFALGSLFFTICSMLGMHQFLGLYALPIHSVATANNFIFWLLARKLFDDDFKIRKWHWLIWLGILILAIAQYCAPLQSPSSKIMNDILTVQTVGFTALGLVQTFANWREDLVENRRILRVFLVIAVVIFTGFNVSTAVFGARAQHPQFISLLSALSFLAISAPLALMLISPSIGASQFALPQITTSPEPSELSAEDYRIIKKLLSLLEIDKIYRQDGLSISDIANVLKIPEHRLRNLINRGLGARNFSNFINSYRINDAASSLGDISQFEVPILTIAFDAGFASLGPFNRAFKAQMGVTPTEYRKAATDLFQK